MFSTIIFALLKIMKEVKLLNLSDLRTFSTGA